MFMASVFCARVLLRQRPLCSPWRLQSLARVQSALGVDATQSRLYAAKAKGKMKDRGKETKGKGKDVNEREDDVDGPAGRGRRSKGSIDATQLVSGSQRVLSGEDRVEYERTVERMGLAVDWFRREVAGMEARGTGRVTPDVLKPVRVALPGGTDTAPVSLQELATVGVRDGTTLVVTAFEDSNLKYIEKAIYAAQIPHVVPQKVDARTLKMPLPKPTVDARAELVKSAAKLAEDTRVQIRRHEQTAVKKMKYDKHSVESEQFHELRQKHIVDVDKILSDMKANLNVK